jgi:hypothetical protein
METEAEAADRARRVAEWRRVKQQALESIARVDAARRRWPVERARATLQRLAVEDARRRAREWRASR